MSVWLDAEAVATERDPPGLLEILGTRGRAGVGGLNMSPYFGLQHVPRTWHDVCSIQTRKRLIQKGAEDPAMSNVLVIFDDIIIRQKLRNALRDCGFRVAATGDGEAALRLAQRARFDVVVADVMATGPDGIEVIKDIQRFLPDTKVIAVSGSSLARSGEFQRLIVRLGVEKFFAMPFNGKDLALAAVDLLGMNPRGRSNTAHPMAGVA